MYKLIDYLFGYYLIAFFGIVLFRYFLIAGGSYFFFYLVPQKKNPKSPSPSRRSIYQDISLSCLSTGIFALAAALTMSAYNLGWTSVYDQLDRYGIWYLVLSYLLVLVLQDTFFYFTHRWFHHREIFPWLHQGHHRSRHPTPWTSFAFDPLEAIVQSLFLVGIVFLLPLHFATLMALLTTMTIWAVLNHLGSDRLPPAWRYPWLGRWLIGPAHHSIHHLRYNLNYGLYFTFWDRLLGTQDPIRQYDQPRPTSLETEKVEDRRA
jgi:Delta7-sterol 5-desaturase